MDFFKEDEIQISVESDLSTTTIIEGSYSSIEKVIMAIKEKNSSSKSKWYFNLNKKLMTVIKCACFFRSVKLIQILNIVPFISQTSWLHTLVKNYSLAKPHGLHNKTSRGIMKGILHRFVRSAQRLCKGVEVSLKRIYKQI